jgi:hypothetical protein
MFHPEITYDIVRMRRDELAGPSPDRRRFRAPWRRGQGRDPASHEQSTA